MHPRRGEGVLIFGPLDRRSSGRAVVTAYLAEVLAPRARCWTYDTTPYRFGEEWPTVLKPLRRGRELLQIARLLLTAPLLRVRCRAAYVPVNADRGEVVTHLVCRLVLRWSDARVFLHHHSYAHASQPHPWLQRLSRRAGARIVHIVGCASMAEDLARAQQAPGGSVIEFSVAHLVARAGSSSSHRGPPRSGPLTLGFFARLQPGKGLDRAIEVVTGLRAEGVPCRLVVAGRARSPRAEREARRMLERANGCEYRGPLDTERQKEEFFAELDCYLFPSTYAHETLPASVLEALRSGCPVYAIDRGCVGAMLGPLAAAGFVQPMDDYVHRAPRLLHRPELARLRPQVAEIWATQVRGAEEQTEALLRRLTER